MRARIITLKRARALRSTMTEPEVMLWARLRRRDPAWPVFRRQHAIGPYILDFYCPAARLAVEVDGAGHGEEAQMAHDARRDAWLGRQGIKVYRVWASTVFEDADDVADGVRRLADERGRALAAPSVSRSAATDTSPAARGGKPSGAGGSRG